MHRSGVVQKVQPRIRRMTRMGEKLGVNRTLAALALFNSRILSCFPAFLILPIRAIRLICG